MRKDIISEGIVVFPRHGVLSRYGLDEPSSNWYFQNSYFDPSDRLLKFSSSKELPLNFEVAPEALEKNLENNTISFQYRGYNYIIRGLREEDGLWISKYATRLPIEAIEQKIDQASESMIMAYTPKYNPTPELLVALAFPDSERIYGLMYSNSRGRWTRIDSEWVLMSPIDNSFEDSIGIPIAPNKADEYVDKYDSQRMTISSTEPYEEKVI
jgi:hypothetical protein